jgi:alkanesulfonate monooxygenase SsuD/methylene tetrahydromethanopterin reductase-like flavin-dependent oxidoreductase (luciferase family)
MTPFRPARPPAGRLARLGVILDADDRAPTLAALCDRAGIDIAWLADRVRLVEPGGGGATAVGAQRLVEPLERAGLGLFIDDDVEIDAFDASPAFAALVAAGRLEVAWRGGRTTGPPPVGSVRARRSVTLDDLAGIASALAVADDLVLPAWRFPDLETAADEVRAEALEAGRDPAELGVAAIVPVSIGRTRAEADARVAADPVFEIVGAPAQIGIFGTLEECQDRVIALAHAGITDLRCIIPATLDVHDVIAQLTSITVGTTDVLIPGSLRSASPPPPDGWGGRGPEPARPSISGGSRRR